MKRFKKKFKKKFKGKKPKRRIIKIPRGGTRF